MHNGCQVIKVLKWAVYNVTVIGHGFPYLEERFLLFWWLQYQKWKYRVFLLLQRMEGSGFKILVWNWLQFGIFDVEDRGVAFIDSQHFGRRPPEGASQSGLFLSRVQYLRSRIRVKWPTVAKMWLFSSAESQQVRGDRYRDAAVQRQRPRDGPGRDVPPVTFVLGQSALGDS